MKYVKYLLCIFIIILIASFFVIEKRLKKAFITEDNSTIEIVPEETIELPILETKEETIEIKEEQKKLRIINQNQHQIFYHQITLLKKLYRLMMNQKKFLKQK